MRRRFNYTERKRIPRDHVLITLDDRDPPSFNAVLELDDLDFPPGAAVVVESYRQRFYARFDYGTVADMREPMDRNLASAKGLDKLKFRVKVVDTSEVHGKLLGKADQLSPEEDADTERKSIFPVLWSETIGNAVWRVDYTSQARPVLELNSLIPGIKEAFLHEPQVKALILPAAVREVLNYMAFTTETLNSASSDDWEGEWLRFISRYYPLEPPPERASHAEVHEWVEGAVDAFCDHFDPRRRFENREGV